MTRLLVGAAALSVRVGTAWTRVELPETLHTLLSHAFRCVPYSQCVLLAVLLADESGDARAIERLTVAWTRSRAVDSVVRLIIARDL